MDKNVKQDIKKLPLDRILINNGYYYDKEKTSLEDINSLEEKQKVEEELIDKNLKVYDSVILKHINDLEEIIENIGLLDDDATSLYCDFSHMLTSVAELARIPFPLAEGILRNAGLSSGFFFLFITSICLKRASTSNELIFI